METMLQARIGHISKPPFWIYSITLISSRRFCLPWQASNAIVLALAAFLARLRGGIRRQRRRTANQFAGSIENGIADLFAFLVITVNDLVQKRIIFCGLSLLLYEPRVFVFVMALETDPSICDENHSA